MKDSLGLAQKILDYSQGKLNESERTELERLMSAHPELAGLLAELNEKSRINSNIRVLTSFDAERALRQIAARHTHRRRRRTIRTAAAAAAAAVILSLGIHQSLTFTAERPDDGSSADRLAEFRVPTLITTVGGDEVVSCTALEPNASDGAYEIDGAQAGELPADAAEVVRHNTVVIPAGYTYKIRLADGSEITLDAGSELSFPEKFTGTVREVEFSGRGYFEVAKSDLPFVVKAGGTQLTVYGTSFNVFYSERLSLAEAVLVEGSIGMRAGDKEVRILPNQQIVVDLAQGACRVNNVDPSDYTGWMSDSFKYKAARLDRIANDISRWYGVDIRLDPRLGEQTFSLEFDKTASIDWVVRALEKISDRTVTRKGGVIYIE